VGGAQPLLLDKVAIGASKLSLLLDGRVEGGKTSVVGSGKHADYGSFTVDAAMADDGPRATLVFADPLPAAGLKDVRVAIAPTKEGFAIDTEGGSMLGPFDGSLQLYAPKDAPVRISIDRLDVSNTAVTGQLTLGDGAASGQLALSGGGLDGTIALAPRGGGQGFDATLNARNAQFGGATPLTIASGKLEAQGLLVDGNSTISGNVLAQGIGYGQLFVGRLAANAKLVNGAGTVTASIAGRRGSRFALQLNADVKPDQFAAIARGEFAGRAITMPRRAVVTRRDAGGWHLDPVQVSYGKGAVVAQGDFGGEATNMRVHLSQMPLSLVDLFYADVGLGGSISGIVDYAQAGNAPPIGSAQVKVEGLTRSGLVLTSRPVDLALVAKLGIDRLETRAVIDEDGERRGRLQARITGMPRLGTLTERLNAGDLSGQLRYKGEADALWRLAAVDAFDLTGPISAAANVTGSLADPRVTGSVASDDLRIRSGLSGTDISGVKARGSFAGSRLQLTSFSGSTKNGGTVSGSGWVDLARMNARRGPALDLKVAARRAALLDAAGLTATVTGPLRIVSSGFGGTIAGRLQVDRASWKLGTAAEVAQLPDIRTREINQPADIAPRYTASAPWRYLIDARAPGRVEVDGMGLDSEWSADIRLRGTTSDPRIGGEARVVRGEYNFAGTSFDLTRGRIAFDETLPIDPRLDIVAETSRSGMDVAVKVQGNALQPEITFSSTPSLPEEEILARLLFGGSVTDLSATDVLQLGAAVASLRGGAGLDPINKLRSAIGLDRLRIVSADPTLGRGTAVALGKSITRRLYVELITDGQGYSATDLEFRITGWLSLLGSVSTVGRDSLQLKVSKDY
ncbi:MAG: translocation/assembly module TamB domain-containing protein, partial [Rhodobacteraceae bacterium]|nr:translocation/assembly module TamB domain-containing protein [Paracoccaceae bacterium]